MFQKNESKGHVQDTSLSEEFKDFVVMMIIGESHHKPFPSVHVRSRY